jgi:hypothetical protein
MTRRIFPTKQHAGGVCLLVAGCPHNRALRTAPSCAGRFSLA